METEKFKKLDEQKLTEINGGTFAYDVGRVIRFIGIYLVNGGLTTITQPIGVSVAVTDWEVNAEANAQ